MVKKKSMALGRGAAALFENLNQTQEIEATKPGPSVIEAAKAKLEESSIKRIVPEDGLFLNEGSLLVDIGQIRPNPNQPRKIFKEKELEELSLSIKENGVIQPLIVTEIEGGFELIAGERRLNRGHRLQ